MAKVEKKFMEGNEAMTAGAIAAGARFFAGYPISPSSEVAKAAAKELPRHGGIYIQMEDELSSMAALLGASLAGKKAFTATSGPGFSLMQENLGLGIMSELPCVLYNVQRSGPSTGAATKPAQGDLMQAKYGTHGDHSIIAISPSSVQDCYDLSITAFNLAEKYRTPVIFLADEVVGHLRETLTIREPEPDEIINRKAPATKNQADFRPYDYSSTEVAPMVAVGDRDLLMRTTGSTHDEKGEFCPSPENIDRVTHYLVDKIEKHVDDITITRKYQMDDADVVLISFGCSVRSSLSAIEILRKKGVKAGLLQLVTVWPMPEKEIRAALQQAKIVIVPELNLGQLAGEVRKYNDYGCKVLQANRTDGILLTPQQIVDVYEESEK
ncbi:2-oxoacid:acceptor oxidoreductase subunit alpha [Acidaminococcus fermentans DSM 20731]|uniref:Pyruvate flavodoxin/ferredoxin oxidoreductase domain protein n=1 Tax=Acidaminococcus fermentans (strain ATCC 25085 / DSM 20731 / CCUG 9996 / CIP 106432 / VR4) TaxID=591001 RepID=D2RN58_ACIFV|nr:2-oxoacid:acceptor oxidoreductase subunit alpha [Acidaminococcus fermentans]ADB46484.1 pyruvate flavodoxin/ferredoxin oxidoreductase domain protein [Acidaminococcus fermentans DSM 20731]UEA72918.1 2-oxoacid:acceptor oxidoreductase subunit alpha [Acidaminococcus fermentans DSM 20731]